MHATTTMMVIYKTRMGWINGRLCWCSAKKHRKAPVGGHWDLHDPFGLSWQRKCIADGRVSFITKMHTGLNRATFCITYQTWGRMNVSLKKKWEKQNFFFFASFTALHHHDDYHPGERKSDMKKQWVKITHFYSHRFPRLYRFSARLMPIYPISTEFLKSKNFSSACCALKFLLKNIESSSTVFFL